jgi:hypothetical protein
MHQREDQARGSQIGPSAKGDQAMNFDGQLKKDTKRPRDRCGATVAPGRDARWRISDLDHDHFTRYNSLDVREQQLEERDFGFGR